MVRIQQLLLLGVEINVLQSTERHKLRFCEGSKKSDLSDLSGTLQRIRTFRCLNSCQRLRRQVSNQGGTKEI